MMCARGFTMLELLVASAVVLVLAGAIFAAVVPVRDLFDRGHQSVDMAAGARTSLDIVTTDLREAGSNAPVAPRGVELTRVLPAIVPLDSLESTAFVQTGGAILLRRVPRHAAQARLDSEALAGESLLRLDTTARCATGPPSCGFEAGDRAALLTATTAEVVTIVTPMIGGVTLASPLNQPFPADALLARIVTTKYGLRPDVVDANRLVRLTDGGAEQPLIDNVVAFEVTSDAIDPDAARRVTLRLRVQAPSADLRGPAGVLFSNGGTARSSRRWLPDVELRTDVAVRNLGGTW